MKRLIVEINEKKHKKLMIKLAKDCRKITGVMRELIDAYIKGYK